MMKEFQPTCFKFLKQRIFLKTRVTDSVIKKFFREKSHQRYTKPLTYNIILAWACGATDNAPDYGSGDSRFESWLARGAPWRLFCALRLLRIFNVDGGILERFQKIKDSES